MNDKWAYTLADPFLPDLLVHNNSYSSLCDVENSSGAAVVEFMWHPIVNATMRLAQVSEIA